MRFGSLFAGIGGFDLAFKSAGMKCAWQVEIDDDCNQVLAKHFQHVKRCRDVRETGKHNLEPVDLICGGFPCTDLSIAGDRKGLAGEQSGLWFEFERVIRELSPKWVVVENVPGLLSSNGGRDMETVVRSLVELGFGLAWRVLDAQYFGVPQRRRRIFIIGSLRDGSAAKVLFERESSCWNPAPSRKAGQRVAGTLDRKSASGNRGSQSNEVDFLVYGGNNSNDIKVATTITSTKRDTESLIVMHNRQQSGEVRLYDDVSPTVSKHWGTGGNNVPFVGVRRLMPVECERLQGFPDGWTDGQADAIRYRQLGNAVAVPVVEWIGKRIVDVSKAEK